MDFVRDNRYIVYKHHQLVTGHARHTTCRFTLTGNPLRSFPVGELGVGKKEMKIRDAIEDDLPAIIDIYNESISTGRSTADTKPITVSERIEWFRTFDSKKRPIWVVEDDGLIVGCVYLSWFYGGRPAYDKTAEISTYIASSYQGKGLGTLLKQ